MTPPPLTDLSALHRHRARATALFFQELVADEIQDRLGEVNRVFTEPAVITPFPKVWHGRLPSVRLVADDEVLDLQPGAHDLVIHALAMHWSNDPVGQIIQCARALRPDGLFIGVLFAGQTLAELRAVLAQAESEVAGGLSPRVLPMAEIRDLGGLMQRSGLALPVADSQMQRVSYRDAFHLMRDLRAMGENNALAARLRRFTAGSVLRRAAALYGAHFPDGPDRIRASFETVYLTGWKPHPSQPQPLRPGSAAARLADALQTAEGKLPQGD